MVSVIYCALWVNVSSASFKVWRSGSNYHPWTKISPQNFSCVLGQDTALLLPSQVAVTWLVVTVRAFDAKWKSKVDELWQKRGAYNLKEGSRMILPSFYGPLNAAWVVEIDEANVKIGSVTLQWRMNWSESDATRSVCPDEQKTQKVVHPEFRLKCLRSILSTLQVWSTEVNTPTGQSWFTPGFNLVWFWFGNTVCDCMF